MENIFLFADLPYQARLRVSRIVSEKFVSPKTHLVRQGEMGDTLYVVVQGEVSVIVDGQEVAVLTNGEHFGELTLVDQQPRSADVFANSFVHVLCIDRESLYEYCTLEPALGNRLLWKLVATLGQRLRQANQQITGGNN